MQYMIFHTEVDGRNIIQIIVIVFGNQITIKMDILQLVKEYPYNPLVT